MQFYFCIICIDFRLIFARILKNVEPFKQIQKVIFQFCDGLFSKGKKSERADDTSKKNGFVADRILARILDG